jgi:hypothetical protein
MAGWILINLLIRDSNRKVYVAASHAMDFTADLVVGESMAALKAVEFCKTWGLDKIIVRRRIPSKWLILSINRDYIGASMDTLWLIFTKSSSFFKLGRFVIRQGKRTQWHIFLQKRGSIL